MQYATPNDLPKPVASGVSKKPDWYPTITQVMTGSDREPTCVASTVKFTKSILPVDQIAPTIPYGMMVGDHVTPIDHAYISLKVAYKPLSLRTELDYVPIYSPADGTIVSLGGLGSPTSHRVVIDHGCGVFSVFMVLNRFAGTIAEYQKRVDAGEVINPGISIKAGEIFGQQRDNPLDFNVFDGSKWLTGFANPASYLTGDTFKPYTSDYLDYFTDELRPYYENSLQKTTTPRIGKIDYDARGGAAGNWFIKDHFGYGCNPVAEYESATKLFYNSTDSSKLTYAWCHLAIAPHEVDNSAWIFSVGWWKDSKGDPKQLVINVEGNQPAPDKISVESGTVIYRLTQFSVIEPSGSPQRPDGGTAPFAIGYTVARGANMPTVGYVALQLKADGTLAIDVSTDATKPSGLSLSPRLYWR